MVWDVIYFISILQGVVTCRYFLPELHVNVTETILVQHSMVNSKAVC